MKRIAADLHIHSALSPCAADEMTPRAIVMAAIAAGLDLIAVCDHNSAENTAAVQQAARDFAGDLFGVIAGMEITTVEEAHIVGLFPDAGSALSASRELKKHLPTVRAGGGGYGRQCVMNAAGEILREMDAMLCWASDLSVDETVALVHHHGGLAVAAHIDRPSFSVISQLGFLPENVVFDALEISAAGMKEGRNAAFSNLGFPIICASDAHFPDNIGDGSTVFLVECPSFAEIALALKGEKERSVCRA
ncbi:MAG TPA: PHP domain-containing protein [Candidatus Hydrogenedentes bacterium]|nr:PHP domain-containing protein [Candidatus Hydrogenedentota bacterium]